MSHVIIIGGGAAGMIGGNRRKPVRAIRSASMKKMKSLARKSTSQERAAAM